MEGTPLDPDALVTRGELMDAIASWPLLRLDVPPWLVAAICVGVALLAVIAACAVVRTVRDIEPGGGIRGHRYDTPEDLHLRAHHRARADRRQTLR